MNEKETNREELDEKIQEIKKQWLEEAKIILETDYPKEKNQLDGHMSKELEKLQVTYKNKFKELLELDE